MSKKVIKKVNSEIFEAERPQLSSTKSYLVENELCLGIENVEIPKRNNQDIKLVVIETKRAIQNIMAEICSNQNGREGINEIMFMLKEAKCYDDLMNVITAIMRSYELYNKKRDYRIVAELKSNLNNGFKNNPNLITSIIIKKLVKTYYYNLIRSLPTERIIELENVRFYMGVESVIVMLEEQFSAESKANGLYEFAKKVINDTLFSTCDTIQKHLCWENCVNASVKKCERMRDGMLGNLCNYEFITDGYQVINDSGLCEKMIVTGCQRYEQSKPREVTSIAARKKGIDAMYIHFFDTETVQEAQELKHYLNETGKLVDVCTYHQNHAKVRKPNNK